MDSNSTTKSVLEKIWNIFTTVLVILIVLVTVFLMGTRIAGLKVYTIISGSMAPTYNVGDLIYVKKVDTNEIQEGDVITFVLNDDLVVATHRVVEVDSDKQHFYTKGDNNQVADIAPVHYKNVIGTPVFSVPYLGYLSKWIQSPPGLYIALAIVVALLGLVFIPDLFIKANKEEAEAKKLKASADSSASDSSDGTADNSPDKAEADESSEKTTSKTAEENKATDGENQNKE